MKNQINVYQVVNAVFNAREQVVEIQFTRRGETNLYTLRIPYPQYLSMIEGPKQGIMHHWQQATDNAQEFQRAVNGV